MELLRKEFDFIEQDLGIFQVYLSERENSTATIKKYMTDIHTFSGFLAGDKIVTKEKILEYKTWLMDNYAVSSANSMLVALNQYLDFLGMGSLKVKRIKVQSHFFTEESRELSKREYRCLVKTAREKKKGSLALLMETICATGIRVSELRYITAEGVQKGRIQVNNKGKIRVIFLPEKLRKKLLFYIKSRKILKGSVFVTKSGKPKDRSNIWTEMKKIAKAAGIEGNKVFPHNLRHLFARTFYAKTGDITGLADLLGHSSLNITRIYTKNSGIVRQQQVDKTAVSLVTT